jgi:hypothetical protein
MGADQSEAQVRHEAGMTTSKKPKISCIFNSREDLEAKLLEAIDAIDRGEATVMTSQDWARLRSDYEKRQDIRNSGRSAK